MKNKRRRIGKMLLLVLLFIFIVLIIYWKIPYSPYKAAFEKQINERASFVKINNSVCTKEEIELLPELLQKHCAYINLEGYKKYQVVNIKFYNTKFVFNDTSGKTIDMDYDLWLFYDKPFRSAYCTSSMYGVPFDGVDYCTDDNQGGMRGILGKTVQIFDEHNEQMYVAGLISWFAESAVLNPSVFLSPYVSYEQIDETHLQVTVSYNGFEGKGMLTFNEEGVLVNFNSNERQLAIIDGVKVPIGWRCEYSNYVESNGIKIARYVRSIKEYPDKEIIYFDSDNFIINYVK